MSTLPFALLFLVAFFIVAFAFRRQEALHKEEKADLVAAFERRYESLGKKHHAQIDAMGALYDAAMKRERTKRLHWREVAKFLWYLLDDIDTLDDVCKNNHMRFRERVRAAQRRRTEVATSDGFVLIWKHEQEKKS